MTTQLSRRSFLLSTVSALVMTAIPAWPAMPHGWKSLALVTLDYSWDRDANTVTVGTMTWKKP